MCVEEKNLQMSLDFLVGDLPETRDGLASLVDVSLDLLVTT